MRPTTEQNLTQKTLTQNRSTENSGAGQNEITQGPNIQRPVRPAMVGSAIPPLPSGWIPSITGFDADSSTHIEPHNQPKIHTSVRSHATPSTALGYLPKTIELNLNNIVGRITRHQVVRKALDNNPMATGISIKSATLDDIQLLPEAAANFPNLCHVIVKFELKTVPENFETHVVSALAQMPSLTSVELDVGAETYWGDDIKSGVLLRELADLNDIHTVKLYGGKIEHSDIKNAFENLQKHGQLKKLHISKFVNAKIWQSHDDPILTLLHYAASLASLEALSISDMYGVSTNTNLATITLLKNNKNLNSLSVEFNYKNQEELNLFSKAVAENTSVKRLALTFRNTLQDHRDGPSAQPLADALKENNSLNMVHLANAYCDMDQDWIISVENVRILLGALSGNRRITDVRLNCIDQENLPDILSLLEQNRALQSLKFSGRNLTDNDLTQLVKAIERHPSLTSFKFFVARYVEDSNPVLAFSAIKGQQEANSSLTLGALGSELQFRIAKALSENQALSLGIALTAMMELLSRPPQSPNEPGSNSLPLLPAEISAQILTLALMMMSGEEKKSLIKAFRL